MPDASSDFEEMLKQEASREAGIAKAVTSHTEAYPKKRFDTRAVMADLDAMENACTTLVNEANALVIKTKAENIEAVNISGKLQDLAKQVKKKCEGFLAPYKKVTSSINGPKKRITDATTTAKNIVNQKIFQYRKKEEIEQARQQKIIDEATKKLQADLKEQADEIGVETPKVAPIQAPKPVTVTRGDTGASVYSRKTWKCEIVDPEKVERKYCLPSQSLLNQAVKMGERTIEGCRIYEDETPVTRSG